MGFSSPLRHVGQLLLSTFRDTTNFFLDTQKDVSTNEWIDEKTDVEFGIVV